MDKRQLFSWGEGKGHNEGRERDRVTIFKTY